MSIERVKELMTRTAVYIQAPGSEDEHEGIRISYCGEDYFVGIGEDSFEEYEIEYSEVDLANDMFYGLTLINTTAAE